MSCIFIFRRDLRLTDNTALIQAGRHAEITQILPIFIYDHNQITGPYCSEKFLVVQEEALDDLNKYLLNYKSRLHRFYGTPYKVIAYLIAEFKPAFIAFNVDYSIYSIERDQAIINLCREQNIKIIAAHDTMLCHINFNKMYWEFAKRLITENIKTQRNNTSKYVERVFKCEHTNLNLKLVKLFNYKKIEAYKKIKPIVATRIWALDRIRNRSIESNYKISAHLKLGLISAREVFCYAKANQINYLIRQMTWRDFYFSCWRAHQNNYVFYDERFSYMQWRNDPVEMRAMWSGKTGYALVDAAMNELNTTGLMANRGRLIVGFFSVKILRINPFFTGYNDSNINKKDKRWFVGGQIYFSRHLIDACYANNTGNWHWVASDTVDSSGQRFGSGWAGRPMNVEMLHSGDDDYIREWLPNYDKYKANQIDRIVDAKERWKEWVALTH